MPQLNPCRIAQFMDREVNWAEDRHGRVTYDRSGLLSVPDQYEIPVQETWRGTSRTRHLVEPEVVKRARVIGFRVEFAQVAPQVREQLIASLANVGGRGRFELMPNDLDRQGVYVTAARYCPEPSCLNQRRSAADERVVDPHAGKRVT
jgi:hypothetical protein